MKTTNKQPKLKSRVTWGFCPVARVKPSKKTYSRKSHANRVAIGANNE